MTVDPESRTVSDYRSPFDLRDGRPLDCSEAHDTGLVSADELRQTLGEDLGIYEGARQAYLGELFGNLAGLADIWPEKPRGRDWSKDRLGHRGTGRSGRAPCRCRTSIFVGRRSRER